MFKTSKRTLLAALAVMAAAAPSTAAARPMIADPVGVYSPTPIAVSHEFPVAQPSSGGFAWADAGIGAAAATVALLGAGSAVVGGRRRRGHLARVS